MTSYSRNDNMKVTNIFSRALLCDLLWKTFKSYQSVKSLAHGLGWREVDFQRFLCWQVQNKMKKTGNMRPIPWHQSEIDCKDELLHKFILHYQIKILTRQHASHSFYLSAESISQKVEKLTPKQWKGGLKLIDHLFPIVCACLVVFVTHDFLAWNSVSPIRLLSAAHKAIMVNLTLIFLMLSHPLPSDKVNLHPYYVVQHYIQIQWTFRSRTLFLFYFFLVLGAYS